MAKWSRNCWPSKRSRKHERAKARKGRRTPKLTLPIRRILRIFVTLVMIRQPNPWTPAREHVCHFAGAKWQSYMSANRCPPAHLRDPHPTFASCVHCSQPGSATPRGNAGYALTTPPANSRAPLRLLAGCLVLDRPRYALFRYKERPTTSIGVGGMSLMDLQFCGAMFPSLIEMVIILASAPDISVIRSGGVRKSAAFSFAFSRVQRFVPA